MSFPQKLGFDLWQLEVFRTIVEAQSLTKGAKLVGLTQPAASQMVANLEKAMGVTLLDREMRPIQATTAGRLLAERAQDLLEQARELESAVRSMSHEAIPVLRIAMVASLSMTLGPEFITELSKSVKRFALFGNQRPVSEQQFLAREVDMLVGIDLLKDIETAMAFPLFTEPFILALPEAWRLDVRSFDDLKGRKFLRHTLRTSAGHQIEQMLRHRRIDFPKEFESETVDTIATMMSAGMGWSITSPLMVLQSRERLNGVKLLPLPGPPLRRRIDLYCRKAELGRVPQEVAYMLSTLLRSKLLPVLQELVPWASSQMHVHDHPMA